MAQPKTSPTSLRIPQLVQDDVAKYASLRKIPRNAAYVDLITQGLKAALAATNTPRSALYAPKTAKARQAVADNEAKQARQTKKRVSAKPMPPGLPTTWPSGAIIEPHHTEDPAPKLTIGDSVTVFQRKPFNPQPKKGTKK